MKRAALTLEEVRSRSAFDCGPATARSVLQFFRKTPLRVDDILRPHPTHGTAYTALVDLFTRHGLPVAVRSMMTVTELAKHTASGRPVLCPMSWGGGHWVAVRGVEGKAVHIMDPDEGLVSHTFADWSAAWKDSTADGFELVRFGVAVG